MLRKANFNPAQLRDEVGRWTDGGFADLHLVNRRPDSRRVTVGGRTYFATPRQETELILAAERAEAALNRVRELDPAWRALPELADPQSAEGAIQSYRSLAQQAEGRITVLERGGVPLGFQGRAHFEDFGRATWDGLAAAGHRDAEPFIRGSAVTGHSFETGEPFDVGRRSDIDLALASPALMRRAEELGIPLRSGGARTMPLEQEHVEALGLMSLQSRLRQQTDRSVTFMIYRSREAIKARGPNLPVP